MRSRAFPRRGIHRPDKPPVVTPVPRWGTVTEIYDYLRLLYARIGIPHCPVCGREISQQTVDQMVDTVLALPQGTKFQVLAPVVRGRKGTQQKELEACPPQRLCPCADRLAISTILRKRSAWKRTRSTRWRSWWTGCPERFGAQPSGGFSWKRP